MSVMFTIIITMFVVSPIAVITAILNDLTGVMIMFTICVTIIIHTCFWVIIGPSIIHHHIGVLPLIYDGAIAMMTTGVISGDLHIF